MPRCQSVQVKARSSPARALTKYAPVPYLLSLSPPPPACPEPLHVGASGEMPFSVTTPLASVVPVATSLPRQSDTRTFALATTWPLSSVVTQASAFSRPSLKCTARLVASAVVRTYIVRPAP